MEFKCVHCNINITNIEKSVSFYQKALGLKEVKRKTEDDGSFILVYLSDGKTNHTLELTWLRDWDRPYNLGDNEFHLALEVDDFDKFRKYITQEETIKELYESFKINK